jgi:NAD(P)-dependent dehydrogenase (short-subunit alcohol dehydrogenase family)
VCSHGHLDLEDGPLETHRTEVFNRTLAINLHGCYFTARAAIPWLKAAGGGSIVLVSSLAALRTPSSIAYGATKGALNAMAKTISGQYAAEGIRCNVICPGAIDTPMLQRARAKHGRETLATNHARRIGKPHDVGFLAAFLCPDESAFITATVQTVDGGSAQH